MVEDTMTESGLTEKHKEIIDRVGITIYKRNSNNK